MAGELCCILFTANNGYVVCAQFYKPMLVSLETDYLSLISKSPENEKAVMNLSWLGYSKYGPANFLFYELALTNSM